MSKKTPVQKLLEDRFQQLAAERREQHEVPAALREKVFATLEDIDLSEVTDSPNLKDKSSDEKPQ